MERVVGVWHNTISKAYPYTSLSQKGVIEDKLGNKDIVIFYEKGTNMAMGGPRISQSRDIGATGVFSKMIEWKN